MSLQTTSPSLTYPAFWRIPGGGDLLFTIRTGYSGNGEYQLLRWNNESDSWNDVHVAVGTNTSGGFQPLIDNSFEGAHRPNVNAYLNDLAFDSKGRLHLTWTWRTGSDGALGFRDYQTNHDLMYARSDDQGVTWKDADGRVYGRAGTHDIDEANAKPVIRLPEGSSFINQSSTAIGPDGTYYLATYWAPLAGVDNHLRQYMLVEYDGRQWKTHQIGNRELENDNQRVPETKLKVFRMSRPVVSVDTDNRVLVVFSDYQRGGGITLAYSESPDRDNWKFVELTHEKMGRWEPRTDPVRWREDGIISLYYEPEGTTSQLMGAGVYEWDPRRYFHSGRSKGQERVIP